MHDMVNIYIYIYISMWLHIDIRSLNVMYTHIALQEKKIIYLWTGVHLSFTHKIEILTIMLLLLSLFLLLFRAIFLGTLTWIHSCLPFLEFDYNLGCFLICIIPDKISPFIFQIYLSSIIKPIPVICKYFRPRSHSKLSTSIFQCVHLVFCPAAILQTREILVNITSFSPCSWRGDTFVKYTTQIIA